MTDARSGELAANLVEVRSRIERAAIAAQRDPEDITLIVVTKFFPAADVRRLADLGVTDVGENRHQEAAEKAQACADLSVRWHYIGGLQSNKAAAVARYADVVQAVDRSKLVAPLERGADTAQRVLDVLLQVSLDPPGVGFARSGADPSELVELAELVASSPALRLRGLMAVAPLGEDPEAAFVRLENIRRDFLVGQPQATWLSAGMSGDLEQAIAHGATHVRVGRAVLGSRPPVQ